MADTRDLIGFANERLHAFGVKLGNDVFCLGEAGGCAVEVDGRFHMQIELHEEDMRLFVTVEACRLDENAKKEFFHRLLVSNMEAGLSGVFFSCHPEQPLLLAHCSLPLEALSEDRIAACLTALLNYAESAADLASPTETVPQEKAGDRIFGRLA